MKFWKVALLTLLLASLLACSDDAAQARKDEKADTSSATERPAAVEKNSLQTETAKTADLPSRERRQAVEREGESRERDPVPDEDELDQADRIVAFSNRARDILHGGPYILADTLKNNALNYRENWSLPRRPKLPARHTGDSRLKAPRGIFSKAEEEQLTKSLDGMDRALNEIIVYYRNLEKYLNDSSIIDDGKKGLELSEKILQSHIQYRAARKSWLALVEAKADGAEDRLLYGHPLQRQILSAKNIFAQMQEIEELADSGGSKRESLSALRQNLGAIVAEAGKPPFQASPSLERLYRNFLNTVQEYCQILDRGILESFHGLQKRELNTARIKCQESYNKFVSEANKMAGERRRPGVGIK